MGKGDKKSKRGKIFMGSYGVSRPARKKKSEITEAAVKEPKVKAVKEVKAETKKEPKKEVKKEPKKETKKAPKAE